MSVRTEITGFDYVNDKATGWGLRVAFGDRPSEDWGVFYSEEELEKKIADAEAQAAVRGGVPNSLELVKRICAHYQIPFSYTGGWSGKEACDMTTLWQRAKDGDIVPGIGRLFVKAGYDFRTASPYWYLGIGRGAKNDIIRAWPRAGDGTIVGAYTAQDERLGRINFRQPAGN